MHIDYSSRMYMLMPDNSELREIIPLEQIRYADTDSEVCFQARMILFLLSRYNDFYMGIADNSELHKM